MKKNKTKNKFSSFSKSALSILGIVIVVSMLMLIWYWESYGRVKFLYTKITVLTQDVPQGTKITDSMTTTAPYESTSLMKNPVINKDVIVGTIAKHFIPAHTPLSPLYFDSPNIVLGKDSFVMEVPSTWIVSIPDTIRRKDTAIFCEVKADQQKIINSQIQNQQNNSSNSNITTYTQDQLDAIKKQVGSPIVSTTVAFVKDSSNKEVIDTNNNDRMNGSGKIASIEVILTQQQFQVLKASSDAGNKFVIMYGN